MGLIVAPKGAQAYDFPVGTTLQLADPDAVQTYGDTFTIAAKDEDGGVTLDLPGGGQVDAIPGDQSDQFGAWEVAAASVPHVGGEADVSPEAPSAPVPTKYEGTFEDEFGSTFVVEWGGSAYKVDGPGGETTYNATQWEEHVDLGTVTKTAVPETPTPDVPAPGPWAGKKQTASLVKTPDGNPAKLKDLDIQPGDTIQLKKGGWDVEVVEIYSNGAIVTKGLKGNAAGNIGYANGLVTPHKVQKADGSKLGLKPTGQTTPVGTNAPGTPGKPAALPQTSPMNKIQLTNALVPGTNTGTTIGSLPDGTVIGTPDGKVVKLVGKPDPAQKYTEAVSVMTGEKLKVQTKHVPTKVDPAPGSLTANFDSLMAAEKAKPKPKKVTKTSALSEWNDVQNSQKAKEAIIAAQANTKSKLTPNQINALKGYTDGTYSNINNSLRKDEMSLDTLKKVQEMDSVFDAIDGIPSDLITHRGTAAKALTGDIEPGKVIYDKGYMSTSPTKPWDRPVILHIRLKAGSKALWAPTTGGDVTAGEDEIVLRRSTMMLVKEVQEVGDKQHVYVEAYA